MPKRSFDTRMSENAPQLYNTTHFTMYAHLFNTLNMSSRNLTYLEEKKTKMLVLILTLTCMTFSLRPFCHWTSLLLVKYKFLIDQVAMHIYILQVNYANSIVCFRGCTVIPCLLKSQIKIAVVDFFSIFTLIALNK